MEKLKTPQYAKLLLTVDTRILLAQFLVYARELGRKIKAAFAALVRVFLQRKRNDALDFLGDVLAQRVQRRRGCVDDLVQ